MTNGRLLVVLGMHRSGTSALTRGLQVLGVGLGDRLMPPVEGNNPKGFWEDIDLNALNIEMLAALGGDWHTLAPISPAELKKLCAQDFFPRAVQILQSKAGRVPIFGFKDPRVAKLLPFWQEVFKHSGFRVHYVLAVRHPISVVKSLAKRDGIDETAGYLLWLGHVIPSLLGTEAEQRILVDYDLLMENPDRELRRISEVIDLEIDSEELDSYKAGFLDETLRHTRYTLHDLDSEDKCPALVHDIYSVLHRAALDKYSLNAVEFKSQCTSWMNSFQRLSAILAWGDRLNAGMNVQKEAVAGCDRQLADIRQTVAERDAQIARLNQDVVERDTQIARLNQDVVERDAQIACLNQDVVERDVRIAGLERAAAERDAELRNLRLRMVGCDDQIRNLNEALVKHDAEASALRHHVRELMRSRSWKITRPLRVLSTVARKWPSLSRLRTFSRGNGGKQEASMPHFPPSDCGEEFDRDFYLRMYPDIANAGINPEEHFQLHGRREGRLGRPPKLDTLGDLAGFDSDKKTILIVSHEASLTGAPILALNLVQELAKRHNVIAMLLGGGVIEKAFHSIGAVVVRAAPARGNPFMAELTIRSLCRHCDIEFALVNSVESRSVLPALAKLHIPTISLIHEFAAYTRPKDLLREAIYWSGEAVFSSGITLESAQAELPDLNGKIAYILPQGRCLVPPADVDATCLERDRTKILHAFRPNGNPDDAIVVLGAGFVQLRKGVDLFIECAARVARAEGGKRCRFVWIGNGFDAERDVNYSVYLADQIRRSNLEGMVSFLDETLAIETAYAEADMLLLSSRLDPMPNVAIDAMVHGLPVLCFDRTTGIAEILTEGGLDQACVAGYLDTADMADKILAMANSEAMRLDVGVRSRALALERFDMSSYVATLERLAISVRGRTQQERKDGDEVLHSDRFRLDFVAPPHWKGLPQEEIARRYVRGWATGIGCRKPLPGFHPGIYREIHGLAVPDAEPFADYLRAGCPTGPWMQEVLSCARAALPARALPAEMRVALHLHVFFPALVDDMLKRLERNAAAPDLFISVPDETARQSVSDQLRNYRGKVIRIEIVPNRGRDIGPFLTAFGKEIAAGYDIVGHLHTKISGDVKDLSVGKNWYHFLLENLVGGQGGAMADTILAAMAADPSIGLVFPDDPYIVGWGANKPHAILLAESLSLGKLPENLNFPVGTMFWARVSVVRPLIELGFDWDDYPDEPLPYDGSLLHAIERILPLLLGADARCAVTNIAGLTR